MKKSAIAFLATFCWCFAAFSQSSDLVFSPIKKDNLVAFADSSTTTSITPSPRVKNSFPLRSFILPAAMFTYGVLALNSDGLEDWNQGIKDEIWVKNPHKQVPIDNYLQWAPGAAVLGLNLAGVHGRHGFKDVAIIYGMTLLIESSITTSVKLVSGETRPNGAGTESFPSGHTANAFCGAELLRLEYKDVSPWYGISGYIAAAGTGFLRIYNNKHWASDVIAGAGVGIASTRLAYYLYPVIKEAFFKNKDLSTIIMPTYENSTLGLGLVHAF
jgi:membrane-associated phospholipid phosphatase